MTQGDTYEARLAELEALAEQGKTRCADCDKIVDLSDTQKLFGSRLCLDCFDDAEMLCEEE